MNGSDNYAFVQVGKFYPNPYLYIDIYYIDIYYDYIDVYVYDHFIILLFYKPNLTFNF